MKTLSRTGRDSKSVTQIQTALVLRQPSISPLPKGCAHTVHFCAPNRTPFFSSNNQITNDLHPFTERAPQKNCAHTAALPIPKTPVAAGFNLRSADSSCDSPGSDNDRIRTGYRSDNFRPKINTSISPANVNNKNTHFRPPKICRRLASPHARDLRTRSLNFPRGERTIRGHES
jgi:hypothetical protein